MRWSTHRRITGKIGKFFGVRDTKTLAEASILPDKEYDYRIVRTKRRGRVYEKKVRIRHHLDPFAIRKIIEYAVEARKWKVKKNKKYIIPLGKAAHYIQDYVIDPRKKILFFKFKDKKVHDTIETRVDRLDIPFDEVYRVNKMKFTFSDFERELKRTKPSTDPEEVMRNATYLTAMLMKVVLRPEYPDDFWEKYRKTKVVFIVTVLGSGGALYLSYTVDNWNAFVFSMVVFIASIINPVFWKKRRDALFLKGDL